MTNPTLEYLQQRIEESTFDLYDTITSITKIKVAKAIDFTIFFAGLSYFVLYTLENTNISNLFLFLTVPLFISMYVLIRALLHGRTIGYLMVGIQFVNVKSKQPVSSMQYLNYIRKTTKLEVRYTELFRYYLNYDNRLNQNQPMRRFGMVLVDTTKYKKFYRDYQDHINRYQQLLQEQA